MADIMVPFPFNDLPIKPELTGKIKVSEDITQTLATLLGWDGSSRRLVKTSRGGVLQFASPTVAGIITKTAGAGNQVQTFDSIDTNEILIRGHPDNLGLVWVNFGVTPTTANGYPLSSTESLIVSLDNLAKLQILIVVSGEKVIVIHTR